MNTPIVVAIDMGYGHLRAAAALADRLGAEVLHCDRAPLADEEEQRLWGRARRLYELTSRVSQLPAVGAPLRKALDAVTNIPPLHPYRDLSAPTLGARMLERYAHRGLGAGLLAHAQATGRGVLTTFFAPAVTSAHAGRNDIFCVVTDSDINRIWAPREPRASRVRYFAPSTRVVRRLEAYGVAPDRIVYTGFPLPHELLGGRELTVLKRNLAARLVRLDPQGTFRASVRDELQHFLGPVPQEVGPPRLLFAVGGAGAQGELARQFLPSLGWLLRSGRLVVTLVAGVRGHVAEQFREAVHAAGLDAELGHSLEILIADDHETYFQRFNARLADSDILWTKPSELTFFAALGLPLVFCPPIGVHEVYNRRWAREVGAGLKQRDPRFAAEWLSDWLADGTLAGAAWSGYMRLPKFGLYRILEEIGAEPGAGGAS